MTLLEFLVENKFGSEVYLDNETFEFRRNHLKEGHYIWLEDIDCNSDYEEDVIEYFSEFNETIQSWLDREVVEVYSLRDLTKLREWAESGFSQDYRHLFGIVITVEADNVPVGSDDYDKWDDEDTQRPIITYGDWPFEEWPYKLTHDKYKAANEILRSAGDLYAPMIIQFIISRGFNSALDIKDADIEAEPDDFTKTALTIMRQLGEMLSSSEWLNYLLLQHIYTVDYKE